MKRFFLLLAVTAALVAAPGCAKNLTFETPRAEAGYYANEALKQVGHVEDTVIGLQAQNQIKLKDARAVIQVCRILDIALPTAGQAGWKSVALTGAWESARLELPELGDLPLTWQGTVRAAWGAAKLRVPLLTTNPALSILTGAIDGALVQIGG